MRSLKYYSYYLLSNLILNFGLLYQHLQIFSGSPVEKHSPYHIEVEVHHFDEMHNDIRIYIKIIKQIDQYF